MNTKKQQFALALGGTLLVGCLTGCTASAWQEDSPSLSGAASSQVSDGAAIAIYAEEGVADSAPSYEKQFKPYEQFGLTYDASKNELQYNGIVVRWFEDYYTIADGTQAGKDFLNEAGVVDVYAVRDFSSIVRADDGSFDPSGKLIGVKAFSAEEFAARDIEAIKNPPFSVAIAGNPPTAKELEDRAKEYEAFGVTYDAKNDQWYFNGKKVRLFQDVLTSNGESLTGGNFHGAIRTMGSADGTIDIYTVRDFANPNTNGYGMLTGIETCSQAEFDEHTQASKAV